MKKHDVVKRVGTGKLYLIASDPWRIGDSLVVKLARFPYDGVSEIDEVLDGCVLVKELEVIDNATRSKI